MSRKWITPIIYTLITLAIFYVGVQMFTNTSSFLSSIIMMIGFAALIYGAIYFFFLRHRTSAPTNGKEMKKYKQAVKQSKQKYKPTNTVKAVKTKDSTSSKNPSPFNSKKNKRKNSPNLRVIQGNKNSKKDRASF
ncbi:SA1362 family protein [Halobacillus seohaensis]|uniref:SA1362 family protein n=1 Tax=Halobacillus seohaensis TaxID=447421 RepID=A0ABW2EJ80_9BACI